MPNKEKNVFDTMKDVRISGKMNFDLWERFTKKSMRLQKTKEDVIADLILELGQ